MLFLERPQTRSHPFQFCLCPGPRDSRRNIAPRAFEFDFRAAARTFVFQLHLIVPNYVFDQFVPREHPFPRTLEFGGFLSSHLWPAPASVHDDGFRSTFRTEDEFSRQDRYGISTARPWMCP